MKDARYTIAREFCGYVRPRYVVRFCGEWLGQHEKKLHAVAMAKRHKAQRDAAIAAA